MTESELTLNLVLNNTPAAGASGTDGEQGSAGASAERPEITTLDITVSDSSNPVVTDLWLYTLDSSNQTQPLTDFKSTAERKSRALMLPAQISGKPSGLAPADDGVLNGLMTATSRGKLAQGSFVSTVDGKVTVTLPAPPTSPILVIAAVEDQRYSGAAAINPDGSAAIVPAGVGSPETHPRRTYADDVAPILNAQCSTVCHNSSGPNGAQMYLLDTRDHLVNDNFALTEQTTDCAQAHTAGSADYDSCIQAIDQAQFLVEPGAPAVTDLLIRSRPDEQGGTSAAGLVWYGGGTPKSRYSAKYGDRRMPSTSLSLDSAEWHDLPTVFDKDPQQFQVLYDWIAQGALP